MSKGRMPKYGARRDDTDKPIREALRECGFYVMILSAPGVPDLAVFNRSLHRWFLGDAKTGKVKKSEKQTWDTDIEPGAIPFWATIEDALNGCHARELWRASVGKMEVITEFAGSYYTLVFVPGSGGPHLAAWTARTYDQAKATHEAAKIAAMNFRDFQTPFSEARMP